MNDITKKLNARLSEIRNAPLQFDGHFGDFFELYVLANLPSKERVLEFDTRLEDYFRSPKPYHLVRKVSSLDQKKTHITDENHLVLASDNSPGWWLHAFLLSDLSFSSDMGEFLFNIPRHMFAIKLNKHMSKAGFHLAHLTDAKNGDTNWNLWSKQELEQRTRFNIHPWNWSLIAKKDWRKYGADKNIIGFIHQAYTEIYGAAYVEWRRRYPLGFSWDGAKIPYSLGGHLIDTDLQIKVINVGITIWAKCIGTNLILSLKLPLGKYQIPHDDLVEWVGNNTEALKAKAFTEGGVYHWPKPSKKMGIFLEAFRTD